MSNVDDLLREFRADMPDPADGAAERILERARGAGAEAAAAPATAAPPPPTPTPAPAPRRRSPRMRWIVLPLAAAAAVCIVIAVGPSRDATHGAPTLLERAEAAITSPNRIVELSTTVRTTTNAPDVVNPHRTIHMRQWTLAGAGKAMQFRILISEGPLDKPPTDEDSTVLTDRTGRVIDQRTWTPLHVRARDNYDYPRGGGRGELEILRPEGTVQGPLTLVDRLRDAYRNDQLKPVGRTAAGDLRFRLNLGTCSRMEFVLDAQTLLPRRIVNTDGFEGCGTASELTSREVSTIAAARSLPARGANRRLLQIGDWPTARTVQEAAHGDPKPLDHVPPVPELDEG